MPTYIETICKNCKKTFKKILKRYNENIKLKRDIFCTRTCANTYKSSAINVICTNCKITIHKRPGEIKKSKSGNSFCSKSCSATQNNLRKTIGTRRSKLEHYIENQLTILYPNLSITYNNKEVIGSELDIYIPSLKLAFELNGIYHYEPIHGKNKLLKIQENDSNKFKLCIENDISLCIIDSSSLKRFKSESAKKFVDIIINIINKNLVGIG